MESTSTSQLKPRVLITHRYCWPENLSLYPSMLKDMAEWHARSGHETTLITSKATSGSAQLTRRNWANKFGIRLIEIPLEADRGKSVIWRVRSTLQYVWFLWKNLRERPADLVVAGTCPPILPGLCASLALRGRSTKFLYYVQDITAEMIGSEGGVTKRLAARLLRFLDRRTVAHADATVTLSEEMKQSLLDRPGAMGSLHVIPNYAIEQPSTSERPASKGPPKLVFAGNQGKLQNLEHFLRAVSIAARKVDFAVELIGDGSHNKRLRELASSLQLSNVAFTGTLPRVEAQARIESADIGVVAAAPGLYQVAYPSKVNSYLLGGLPVAVFAESDSSMAAWLHTHDFGATCSPDSVEVAASDLISLVRRYVRGEFDRQEIASRSADILSPQRHQTSYGRIVQTLLNLTQPTKNGLRKRSHSLRHQSV